MRTHRTWLLLASLWILWGGMAHAQVAPVPPLMNFQGRLTHPDGTPVADGSHLVVFTLFDAFTEGTPRWTETQTVISRNGVFAILLGSAIPLNETVFAADRWLEIRVDGTTLSPRQKIVSTAFAFRANLANTVPDGSITASKLATDAKTAGGDLTGTYPNPGLATLASSLAKVSGNVLSSDGTNIALNNRLLLFRSLTDANQGLGYYNTWNGSSIDGPVLFGYSGGALGTRQGNMLTSALSWNSNGYVGIGTPSSSVPLHIVGSNSLPHLKVSASASAPYGAFLSLDATATTGGKEWLLFASGGSAGEGMGKLVFKDQTAGKTRMVLDSNGFLGVGVNNPDTPVSILPEANGYHISLNDASGPRFKVGIKSGGFSIGVAGVSDYNICINNVGNVGIGYIGYANRRLAVNGNIQAEGSIYSSSDARYKQNIVPIANALDAILNLRGVTFDWNRAAWKERSFPAGQQIGFIAQEVEKVLPQLVSTDEKGYKSVAYVNVVPVLVEAIKQQQAQIGVQQKQIDALNSLKAENAALKLQLAELSETVRQMKETLEALRANPANR